MKKVHSWKTKTLEVRMGKQSQLVPGLRVARTERETKSNTRKGLSRS